MDTGETEIVEPRAGEFRGVYDIEGVTHYLTVMPNTPNTRLDSSGHSVPP